MVKAIRGAVNGHAKLVGGFAGCSILLAVVGLLGKPWFDGVTHAAAQVPVIEQWQDEHARWSLETLDELKNSIDTNAVAAQQDRTLIRAAVDQRFDDKLRFDQDKWNDQKQWNNTMLGLLMKIDDKLDRAIETKP